MGGAVAPLLINKASEDPQFSLHPGLRLYGIESYIAVPLNRRDGSFFGTLCALDTLSANLSENDFDVFHLLAELIAFELEEDETQRRKQVEHRALEDFISIAAHDLRQPLTVMYGRAQLLARRVHSGVPAGDLVEQADLLLAQTKRAVLLSDTLLDVARMQSGHFTLDKSSLDLVVLVRQTLENVKVVAPEHRFMLDAPSSLAISGDQSRLGQVLQNLLDNAVKYSPDALGPIQVTVYQSEREDKSACAEVSIADQGIGVSDEDLSQLFERHYRAETATARGISGSGLGLYIARQIIEAHGGSIWAEHRSGGGLVVHIALPCD